MGENYYLSASQGSNFKWKWGSTQYYAESAVLGTQTNYVPTTNGWYFLTADLSYCGTTITRTVVSSPVTITPRVGVAPAIGGISSRYQGAGTNDFTFASAASNASSYVWSISNAGSSTITSNISKVNTGEVIWDPAFVGQAIITLTFYGCGGSVSTTSHTVNVNVYVPPCTIYSVYGGATICQGGS